MKKKNNNEQNDQLQNLENQIKRVLADYQNLEKRTEENRREWMLSANRNLVMKLLPALDDLFLAQKHINDQGLDISIQKFLNILKEEGVEIVPTKDQVFDPNTMECVSVQEGEENKVLEELADLF